MQEDKELAAIEWLQRKIREDFSDLFREGFPGKSIEPLSRGNTPRIQVD